MAAGMPLLLFTKLFGDRTPDEVGQVAAELGFDGIDLLIRPGCTVEPDGVDRLADVVSTFRSVGLTVPMATTDLTDPAAYPGPAEALLGSCAEAGIRLIRLGYWTYDGTEPYADARARADRDLDRLAGLASRFGVRLAIQLHGGTIHSSGALARVLLERHDPAQVCAYPDPGNQAVQDGREDWRLTFDVLEPWLACVGVKNGGWFADTDGRWSSEWLGLSDGMVPWPDILRSLGSHGFDGPLTLHSHYERPYEDVLAQTGVDLTYVRGLIDGT
jgi:sugar phosphate isomerase/epimerase